MLEYIVRPKSPDFEKYFSDQLADMVIPLMEEIVRREQSGKINLDIKLFELIHSLPQCRLESKWVGNVYNGWYSPEWDDYETSPVMVRRCLTHNTESRRYVDDPILGKVDLAQYPVVVVR